MSHLDLESVATQASKYIYVTYDSLKSMCAFRLKQSKSGAAYNNENTGGEFYWITSIRSLKLLHTKIAT